MIRLAAVFWAGALLAPATAAAFAESPAMAQLRAAADASERAAAEPSLEGAAAGNQVWSENAVVALSAQSGPAAAVDGRGSWAIAAPLGASRPSLVVAPVPGPVPAPELADPVPPKIKGWEGLKLGVLGTEALGLRLLSKTGPLAVPLLILLQPIIAPIALVAGLLGLLGKRL